MISRLLFAIAAVALIIPTGVPAAKGETVPTALLDESTPIDLAQRSSESQDHSKEGSHARWMQWLQSLDLSDEQMQQIRTIYQQTRGETSSLRQQLRETREQMYSMLTSDVEASQIVDVHQQVQTLQQELENQHFAALLEVRDVLTPEQRVRVADTLRRYQEQHRSHRHR